MCRKCIGPVSFLLALSWITGLAYGQSVKINFQTQGAPIPAGYLRDYGQVFGDRGNGFSYGWDRDKSADTRAKNISDPRWNTLIHF